jgi:hypothetical protein
MSDSHLFGDSRLPEALDARVRSELDQGEQLLWVGQPLLHRVVRISIPIVIFGIVWTAFALVWIVAASIPMFFGLGALNNARLNVGGLFICFPLFGVPFVLIGLGLLGSPIWLRRLAKNNCYALTDRRAIIWQSGLWGSVEVRSYRPADLTKIIRRDYADGSGDLVFEEQMVFHRSGDSGSMVSTQQRGFLGIANVREIEELLRKALLADHKG